jgi:hypothetical protein
MINMSRSFYKKPGKASIFQYAEAQGGAGCRGGLLIILKLPELFEILSPQAAAQELGAILRSSPDAAERIEAAQILGRYKGQEICRAALQEALETEQSLEVRTAIREGLGIF